MRGTAMGSTAAAASGFVVFLLSVSVVQGQNGWGVTYTSTHICALKGSTVVIRCTYSYPLRVDNHNTAVDETLWFSKLSNNEPVDLRTDPDYRGRVQYRCDKNVCTLNITDLRERDSAEYKFRFITNQEGGGYTGSPGVFLTVTVDPGVQVHVGPSSSTRTELTCHSNCQLPVHPSYIWYKNWEQTGRNTAYFYLNQNNPDDYYNCALSGYESSRSLSVYGPKLLSVSVNPSGEIIEGSSVTLTCSSDANPAAKYTWYKKNVNPDLQPLSEEPQLVFSSIQSSDSGEYYCTAENQLGNRTSKYIIDVKYGPKLPSVSVSPSAEIMEGSSVTLNCSSDANPASKYTWYKVNQALPQGPGGIYYFTSISYKDRGFYHCTSMNNYGQINSSSHFIDVHYGPKLPSVSVSPSGEIIEGSSVTLTCSSDANPAASYTWYNKGNQKLPSGPGGKYNFLSISSEDSGIYYCKSENQYGQINSTSLFIDVWYAPKLPSVSVSPSAEIVEGSSVSLTCSSDANPAANYTWYKENEDSLKASGQIFTITDVRPEHSGKFYCVAQNRRGRHNSTLHLTVAAGTRKAIVTGTTTAVLLAIILFVVFLFIIKKWPFKQSSEPGKIVENRNECLPTPGQPEDQDDIHYASIKFSNSQTDAIYSNVGPARLHRHEVEEEVVEYAAVKFISVPRTSDQGTEEDPAALYSTVKKT